MNRWRGSKQTIGAFSGILMLLLVTMGCGKKTRPIPRDARAPRAVRNLQIKKLAGAIQLRWEEPKKDLRGDKLKGLAGYHVLRKFIKPGSGQCLECPAGFTDVADLDRDHPVSFKEAGRTILWTDHDVKTPGIYVYRIVPFSVTGYDGAISNYVSVKIP
jgi:hypothetical protein